MASTKKGIARTATEALKLLWQEGFFRSWQTQRKIVSHLAKRGHNFTGLELKRAKHLTRRGSRGNYEYVCRSIRL